jgi:hypothetical protein
MRGSAILSAVLLMTGCGQSNTDATEPSQRAVQTNGGAENCSTAISASVADGIVSVSMTGGFNAWKNVTRTTVTVSGTVTDACGTNAPFSGVVPGTWTFAPGSNQSCSASWSGSEAVPAAAANHWHYLVKCDGSKVVVGCQSDKTVSITTAIDGPGNNDFTGSTSAIVPAVQDPDEVETGCGGGTADPCDIGACVSACEHACSGPTCHQCCECRCKAELEPAGCPPPQNLCYTGSAGHAVCLP